MQMLIHLKLLSHKSCAKCKIVCCYAPQTKKSHKEVARNATSPYFRLYIQGDMTDIIGFKFATEEQLMEAGSSLLKSPDHLFKLFWIFYVEHKASCENFHRYL